MHVDDERLIQLREQDEKAQLEPGELAAICRELLRYRAAEGEPVEVLFGNLVHELWRAVLRPEGFVFRPQQGGDVKDFDSPLPTTESDLDSALELLKTARARAALGERLLSGQPVVARRRRR